MQPAFVPSAHRTVPSGTALIPTFRPALMALPARNECFDDRIQARLSPEPAPHPSFTHLQPLFTLPLAVRAGEGIAVGHERPRAASHRPLRLPA